MSDLVVIEESRDLTQANLQCNFERGSFTSLEFVQPSKVGGPLVDNEMNVVGCHQLVY